jgi:uncharacterized protein (DUF2252 family)
MPPAPVEHTPAERAARGKSARTAAPRASHAGFSPAPGRPDPVALLERQAVARVPELLPIRYGRMLASPFTFLRGAALIMASDLSASPVTGLTVQACGDAHLSNFGVFASPQRRLVFDVNDFDETLPGPWEWDVKRLAASIEVAARGSGFTRGQRRRTVLAALARYRQAMRGYARQAELDVWYAPAELDELSGRYRAVLGQQEERLADADLARIRDRDGTHALSRLIQVVKGKPRFVNQPPLLVPIADLPGGHDTGDSRPRLHEVLAHYSRTLQPDLRHLLIQFQVADAARKVVGIGSVGTRCWITLLTGRDPSDLLVLQVKEAEPSVLSGFTAATMYPSQGERVVAGQRLMQVASDIFLGWHRAGDRRGQAVGDCYVRQSRDWKYSLAVEAMDPRVMRSYGSLCGQTLARAHARSGDRIAIAAYLGGSDVFDQAVADFAAAYADQNERDHASLAAAVASGRLTAERGV